MATKTGRRFSWKLLRVVSQSVAALAFVVYFYGVIYPLETPWLPDLVFLLDPLNHLYLLVSGNGLYNWVFAVVALVLLFAVSRIFCGWFCPFGALLDLISGIRGRIKLLGGNRLGDRDGAAFKGITRQKNLLPANFDVYLLGGLLVLAAFGQPVIWFFDPIVNAFKLLTLIVNPVLDTPLRLAYNGLDARFYDRDWWFPVQDGFNFAFGNEPPLYVHFGLFLGLMVLIIAAEFYQRRFWCRYLCPLGALLRLTYWLHPVKRRIKHECRMCLRCDMVCHFGGTNESDCVYCMDCIDSCKFAQVTFLPTKDELKPAKPEAAPGGQPEGYGAAVQVLSKLTSRDEKPTSKGGYRDRLTGKLEPAGISRRTLLLYLGGGLLTAPVVHLLDRKHELPLRFIRPPGVADEALFVEKCIKCGECLKACLTNGLQPSGLEAGISALWTPRLIARLGGCEYECNMCGRVCPTGAIPRLSLEEKQQQVMGIAYIDKHRCIPYITTSPCSVCEEHCPTSDKAIKLKGPEGGHQKPYIDEELCIGCGTCEQVCPVTGRSAILVTRRTPGDAFRSIFDETPEDAEFEYGYGDYPEGDPESGE